MRASARRASGLRRHRRACRSARPCNRRRTGARNPPWRMKSTCSAACATTSMPPAPTPSVSKRCTAPPACHCRPTWRRRTSACARWMRKKPCCPARWSAVKRRSSSCSAASTPATLASWTSPALMPNWPRHAPTTSAYSAVARCSSTHWQRCWARHRPISRWAPTRCNRPTCAYRRACPPPCWNAAPTWPLPNALWRLQTHALAWRARRSSRNCSSRAASATSRTTSATCSSGAAARGFSARWSAPRCRCRSSTVAPAAPA